MALPHAIASRRVSVVCLFVMLRAILVSAKSLIIASGNHAGWLGRARLRAGGQSSAASGAVEFHALERDRVVVAAVWADASALESVQFVARGEVGVKAVVVDVGVSGG